MTGEPTAWPVPLLVMSVTRLGDGVCVARVDSANRWVRPTRESSNGWRQLEIGDLNDARGQLVVEVGNLVEWPLGNALPRDAHTEDVQSLGSPVFSRRLTPAQMLQRCAILRTRQFVAFLGCARSLALIEPTKIGELHFAREGPSDLRARVCFECDGRSEDLSVTDLQWRALGRCVLGEQGATLVRWSHADLIAHIKRRIVYLVIGRGQPLGLKQHPLAGRFWPFVTTVITMPETREPINCTLL